MKASLLILAALPLFAGQSIQVSTTQAVNSSITARAHNLPSMVEWYMHDWPALPVANLVITDLATVGFTTYIDTNGYLNIGENFDIGASGNQAGCLMNLSTLAVKAAYIRFRRDPSTKTATCEGWDNTGTRFYTGTWTWTSDNAAFVTTGGQVGGVGNELRSVAFLRILSALVPLNSRSPVTADTSGTKLLEWKFDNSLADASGNGWTATMSSGSPTYVTTPYQNVIAVVKTSVASTWSNWLSLRAGYSGGLDGTNSFSQSDASATVTCFWQALSGPSVPVWTGQSSCSPTVTGLVFGNYKFQVTATDTGGVTGITSLDVGAVATDANGVVIQGNPNADLLYGPMIAFGKNPWGYQDERSIKATTLRSAAYDTQGYNPPIWTQNQTGTVAYQWYPYNAHTTTTTATLLAADTTITVTDATKIDTSELPTYVRVGNEEIKVCSPVTATTLTICYDGRQQGTNTAPPASDASGASVQQVKFTGTGTSFLSTICPAGVGQNGPLLAGTTGTMTLTANSTAAVGVGTNWSSANIGYVVRASATHATGTAFTFFTTVTAVADATHLTLGRVYPADADTGTFAYTMLQSATRNIVAHYTRADGADGSIYFQTTECGSNTSVYTVPSWDISAYYNMQTTGAAYSYMDGYGFVKDQGVSYYDEGLSHYALYLRSGWGPALTAFRKLEGQEGVNNNQGWLTYPEIAQSDGGAIPRYNGVTGAAVAAVLDGKVSNWSALRSFANVGVNTGIGEPCTADTRENAYRLSWLALAALFDPVDTGNPATPNQKSYWKAQLANAYTRDNNCKSSDNSFRASSWNTNTGLLTMTNGSSAVTGSSIPATLCANTGTVTGVSVTNGSDVVTGTGFTTPTQGSVWSTRFVVTGTSGGVSKHYAFNYLYDNSGQIHISGMYPGDTATGLTGYIESDDSQLSFGTDASDPQLQKNWSCTWTDASHITLDRPWDGTTNSSTYGGRAFLFGLGLIGNGQQPFILGIKTLQMSLASKVASSPTNTNYAALGVLGANWIESTGFDSATGGLHYGRLFGDCEPVYAASSQPEAFHFRNPQCSNSPGITNAASAEARARSAEAQNATRMIYENSPTQANKDFGDQFYGSQWGATGYANTNIGAVYNVNGIYSDGNTTSNVADANLGSYKWTGFFFGIGMSHQWPAVRLGGVAAPVNRTVNVGYSLANVPNATVFQILLTSPSGATTTVACAASPCAVTANAVQGNYLMQLQYLNAGKVLAQSDQTIGIVVQ